MVAVLMSISILICLMSKTTSKVLKKTTTGVTVSLMVQRTRIRQNGISVERPITRISIATQYRRVLTMISIRESGGQVAR